MLQHEPDRAFYGLKQVEKANEAMAIDTLLISDELFRHQDVATRSRYVRLVDSVKENAGTVRIFSSLHVSGEQLSQLTGIAAILRFPVPELSDQENDSSSEEDEWLQLTIETTCFSLLHCYIFSASCEESCKNGTLWFSQGFFMYFGHSRWFVVGRTCFQTEQ